MKFCLLTILISFLLFGCKLLKDDSESSNECVDINLRLQKLLNNIPSNYLECKTHEDCTTVEHKFCTLEPCPMAVSKTSKDIFLGYIKREGDIICGSVGKNCTFSALECKNKSANCSLQNRCEMFE